MGDGTVIAVANVENWIGSSEAKSRLQDGCGPEKARTFAPGGLWYAAHCNGNGLHVYGTNCQWEWDSDHGQDMEIWLGFDPHLGQYCGDGYSTYEYWDQPTVNAEDGGFERIAALNLELERNDENYHLVIGMLIIAVAILFA